MERSSPLAAMQPPSLPFSTFGCRADARDSYNQCGSNFGGRLGFGPTSFNFKDLSMIRAPTDYFSLKPVRGSSPTASLAADLSQNFHIDQSPQLPTPRRALFSSNLFGTLNGRETTVTPPPPSSSPGFNESMEISPLPHKAPFFVESQIEPTPEETMEDDATPSMDTMQDTPTEPYRQPGVQERRRPNLLRPSLSRTKGFTTSALSLKPARVECPPFKFGNGASMLSPLSPQDSFGSLPSPPSRNNGRPQSADSPSAQPMGPPRFKQPSFSNLNGHLRSGSGAPIGHVRKQSNPFQRPRKQFRRSLSMFEKPQDVMKEAKAGLESNVLDSIMDVDNAVDNAPKLQLPHDYKDVESIPRITKDTMIDVLDGKYGHCYDRSLIVDCRFEYEYDGGHIDGAVNYNNKEEIAKKLFEEEPLGNTLLIFHCEYSVHRAPIVASHVREHDRAANAHCYPNLTYPEVYILDGGYSSFFDDHTRRCSPQNYVPMGAKEHEAACERGLAKVKRGGRTKLSRAQTFAFGQHNSALDDSPTAPSRKATSLNSGMDIAIDEHSDPRRLLNRRMVSF